MAVSNGVLVEVRSTAAAGNVNGGGFVSGATGTDFAINDTPVNLTGVTSAGAGNVCLHASAAATWVGNVIKVVSGTNFTASRFEILSVVVGVSFTCGTDNTGASISTGVGATGTMNVGGAIPLGSADDAVFEQLCVPGAKWYFRGGAGPITYVLGGAVAVSATGAGTVSLPVAMIGYSGSRGTVPTNATMPIIDCGANRFSAAAIWRFYYLSFTSTVTTSTVLGGTDSRMFGCKVLNRGASSTAVAVANIQYAEDCEFSSYRGIADQSGNNPQRVNCYYHHSDIAFNPTGTGSNASLVDCVFEGMVTNAVKLPAVSTSATVMIRSCTFYGSEAKIGVGVLIPTGAGPVSISKCTFSGFATAIQHADTNTAGYDNLNNFFNNTADVSAAGQWQKGTEDTAINPGFVSVTQLTGTTATTSSNQLVASGFGSVVPGADWLYVASGTGVTAGFYAITAATATTLTTDPAISNNAVADKVYTVFMGHNFAPGVALMSAGRLFPGGLTTKYLDVGAIQRAENYPTAAQTLLGVVFGNLAYTGTRRDATASEVLLSSVYGPGDTFTGTRRDAPVASVLTTQAYGPADAFVGTYLAAAVGNVKINVVYGALSALTGTYDGSDRWTDPSEALVIAPTAYKANSTTNNKVGTWVAPQVATVLENVLYGAGGTGSTGTLSISSSPFVIPL